MALSDQLTSKHLGTTNIFNWPWFIELFVCGILVLFFLFYFNRLFATVVSYFVRLYTWRQYRVWIGIQSLQISLLGGRLFFKGVRYHGENETILVHSGYITWRYWLRTVKEVELDTTTETAQDDVGWTEKPPSAKKSVFSTQSDEELGTTRKANNAQARIAMTVSGVEWFLYNRTPLYDAILRESGQTDTRMKDDPVDLNPPEPMSPIDKVKLPSILRQRKPPSERSATTSTTFDAVQSKAPASTDGYDHGERKLSDVPDGTDVTLAQSLLIRALPMYIDCSRIAVSMGNENTKALLVTTVEKARGHVDARGCGHHDLFRQLFDFEVEHPIIQMRPNPDYQSSQSIFAERFVTRKGQPPSKEHWWRFHFNFKRRSRNLYSSLRTYLPWMGTSLTSLHRGQSYDERAHHDFAAARQDGDQTKEWHGLGRYLDENEEDEHQAWEDIDYARFSTLVDCPAVHLKFFWDAPGRVKASHLKPCSVAQHPDINGARPPAYGLDLVIKGGSVNYGPWADRLRAELQAVFLPASYKSATAASSLRPGDWRQSTRMIINIEIEKEVTLRVPTRERSKDWLWRGRSTAVRDAAALRKQRERRHLFSRRGQKGVLGPDIRPFGWLSITVAADSCVRYEMDMVAGPHGYLNKLELDLKETQASSSVNHALLWKCRAHTVTCDLSNPLQWNGPHEWTFDIVNHSMDFYLLRDHMFLMTDLISDFTAGSRPDYMTFVPFTYKLGLKFDHLRLFLNANDFNIIDNPCDMDGNAFLILGMPLLDGQVTIPMQSCLPAQSGVQFQAHGRNIYLNLQTPTWNTFRNFSAHEVMATLDELDLDGSYNYNTATSPALTDSLIMDIVGTRPKFHLQGFLIRFFMNVKENYFGDHLHYRTLEEFQKISLSAQQQVSNDTKPGGKKDNDLDVVLSVRTVDSCALMPAGIYDRTESLRIDVMDIEADMRFTNYYMDLQVNSSPVESSIEIAGNEAGHSGKTSGCQLFIDTVSVYGHRLFGAPPSEPTYVCNWDFDVGSISGECDGDFLRVAAAAIQSFIYTMDDDQNALKPPQAELLHDVTFLRARTSDIRVWITNQKNAFLLEVAPSDVKFNDWAGELFSQQLKVTVPQVTIAGIQLEEARRHNERSGREVPSFLYLETSVCVAVIARHADFEQRRNLQQQHVQFHDSRTLRAQHLARSPVSFPDSVEVSSWSQQPANIPIPSLPDRLINNALIPKESVRKHDGQSSRSKQLPDSNLCSSPSRGRTGTQTAPDQSAVVSSPNPKCEIHTTCSEASPSRYKTPDETTSTGLSFSSAWLPPYFSLRDIKPGCDDLPSIPEQLIGQGFSPQVLDTRDLPLLDQSIAHESIIVKLPSGIRGFCASHSLAPVLQLVSAISPQSPSEILDSVERVTISNILRLDFNHARKISDLAVYLPGAAFRLGNQAAEAQNEQAYNDHYDVQLAKAQLMLRTAPTATKQSHGHTKEDVSLAQVSIQRLSLDASERCEIASAATAALGVVVHEAAIWLSVEDKVRSDIQVGAFQATTNTSTVDRLSLLLDRSSLMVEKFADDAKVLQNERLQDVVHYLAIVQKDIPDPAFLSRTSYILRSAEDHVRLSNAWTAVIILRHRLSCLSPKQCDDLIHAASQPQKQAMTGTTLLTSLSRNATNGHNYENYRPLLITVLGDAKDRDAGSGRVVDVQANTFIGRAALVLDPGPSQSQIVIEDCDLAVSQSPVLQPYHKDNQAHHSQRSKITVQTWMASCHADLNWELVELIDSLLLRIQDHTNQTPEPIRTKIPSDQPIGGHSTNVSVIAGANKAQLRLRSLNLDVAMKAENLQSSVTHDESNMSSVTSALLASSSAQLKISSNDRALLQTKIKDPNIFIATQNTDRRAANRSAVKVAASCGRLNFDLTEGPSELLLIGESVLRDEIALIRNVISHMPKGVNGSDPQPAMAPTALPEIHVALFLSEYKLKFAVLPTVNYVITGETARTSVVPTSESHFAIHVDVKRNNHFLLHPRARLSSTKSVVEIPPVSGHIKLALSSRGVKLGVHSVLEKITIEASAIQTCLDAVYHPENAEYIKTTYAAFEAFEKTLKQGATYTELKQKTKVVQRNETSISYKVQLVFAGFEARCTAPVHRSQEYDASLIFAIRHSTINLHSNNHAPDKQSQLPQFVINAPGINISLERKSQFERKTVGSFTTGLKLIGQSDAEGDGINTQTYRASSSSMNLDLLADSPAVVVDMVAYLQDRIKAISAASEQSNMKSLRRLTIAREESSKPAPGIQATDFGASHRGESKPALLDSTLILELNALRARWIVDDATPISPSGTVEDLVFSIRKIDFRSQRETSARLAILDLQLQVVPKGEMDTIKRTRNSALMPEVVFKAAHLSSAQDRRFAFQAAGKALDLKLAADGIFPIATIQRSLTKATAELRKSQWASEDASQPPTPASNSSILGNKRLASLLVDADFAGAILSVTSRSEGAHRSPFSAVKGPKRSRTGRFGQARQSEIVEEAVLRAPGVALKVEYQDTGRTDPTLNMEVKVAASNNTLAPTVVPLILDITSSVKEIIGDSNSEATTKTNIAGPAQKYLSDAANQETDPTTMLGRVKVNASLWVQRQEFSLTCQPIARVQATALFDDIFVTVNTVQNEERERFFSVLTKFNNLQASVQHIYSRESTASFEVESIVMSLMNSKHVSAKNGLSAILTISPMKTLVNARQLQDFLLFREIWYPEELRATSKATTPAPSMVDSQTYAMLKYQEFTATAALPWHAVISIQELMLQVDFGQALGKSSFTIARLWASSRKNSDSEQNLCVGFDRIGIESTGRMSGFVELQEFRGRTAIKWPRSDKSGVRAPLVQASLGFGHLRLKAAFDYQPFAVADISSFEFLMYNVRPEHEWDRDRLVGILDGGKIQIFCTSTAGGQTLAIIQAFERLIQEKREAYQDSLHEVERLLRRKSGHFGGSSLGASTELDPAPTPTTEKTSYALHTDVVVTLKAIDIGVFPNTFFDNQILKIDAANAQARFAVATVDGKIRSGLGMSLGQVRVALSAVGRSNTKALGEVEVTDVIERGTMSKGGTILKVPRLVASMQTWQQEESHVIEYVFRSTFQGKVDVGWNYSRISFIRGMWDTHSQALAQRLGKPLPPAAVKITTDDAAAGSGKEKITAVVNMPQSSKYEYVALEPPVIETPQLRDMGEATPPLEWIGLHRDKLPNVTHSIVIVTLLEVAREVEGAYTRILGTG